MTTERALRDHCAPGAGVAFRHASIADLAVLEYVASTTPDAKVQATPMPEAKADIGRLARGTMQEDPTPPSPSPTEYSFHRRKPKPKP